MQFEQADQQLNLNFQHKKIMHMIDLQVMDIESTLHYIQKKHSPHQLKQAFSQIYNIFNQLEPVFQHIKAMFLNRVIKKLMNCFGIIYLIQAEYVDRRAKDSYDQIPSGSTQSNNTKIFKETLYTQQSNDKCSITFPKALGGIHLYNQSYQRNISGCPERRPRITVDKKLTLSKEELTKAVTDQINDVSLSIPHPDQMLDLFAFKIKYSKKDQIVTFHEELQSIAKYFKDAQNDAYEFLNKCKSQQIEYEYNESFKDIMSLVKLQKQAKLKDFNQKISSVFRNIKKKTQYQINQIQAKLEEVEVIKNNYQPPETENYSTQTSNTYEEELKYLKRKCEDAEEKYNILSQIKKKEIEQAALNQIAYENEVSMKAREVVYLKLSDQENKMIIKGLNKRIKSLIESHRYVKQRIIQQIREKNEQKLLTQIQGLQCLNGISSESSQLLIEEDDALQSLKKQRQMAKLMILEARRDSLSVPKSHFTKRFTHQQQINVQRLGSVILDKWNLSQISQNDSQKQDNLSSTSNRNNLLTQNKINVPTQNKINYSKGLQEQNKKLKRQPSRSSIKSSIGQLKKKAARKKTSHFIEMQRNGPHNFHNSRPSSTYQDNLSMNGSDEEDDCNSNGMTNIEDVISKEEVQRIDQMYQKQINKMKSRIGGNKRFTAQGALQGKSSQFGLHRANLSSRFQPNRDINARSSLVSSSSVYQARNFLNEQVLQLRQTEEDEDIGENEKIEGNIFKKIQELETQIQNLRNKLSLKQQKKQLMIVSVEQASLFVQPSRPQFLNVLSQSKVVKHVQINSQKMRTENDKETEYSELKTRYGQLQSEKEKKNGRNQQSRLATQVGLSRQLLPPRSSGKNKFASEYVKRPEGRLKTNIIFKTEKTSQQERAQTISISSMRPQNVPTGSCEPNQSNILLPAQPSVNQRNKEIIEKQKFKSGSSSANFRSKTGSKNIHMHDQEVILDRQEEQTVRQIVMKCKNIKQFKKKIEQLHYKRCGENCSHLQQYISNFNKYREENKIKIKMHIENVHQSIDRLQNGHQLPKLTKKK